MACEQNPHIVALSTACTPQTAVFQTIELLEMILDNLTFPDLAACQAVCATFRAVIEESSLLKWRVSHETVRTETLRYLATSGGAFGFVVGPQITARQLCPLLSFEQEERSRGSPPDCFPSAGAKLSITEYMSSPAIWDKVYLTNPPVAEAWIQVTWRVDSDEFEGIYSESRRIESEDRRSGLTLGRLYNGLLGQRRWTASCGAWRKGLGWGGGNYLCARRETVAGSLARLEELTGAKAEAGSCWVHFPRMMGVWER